MATGATAMATDSAVMATDFIAMATGSPVMVTGFFLPKELAHISPWQLVVG